MAVDLGFEMGVRVDVAMEGLDSVPEARCFLQALPFPVAGFGHKPMGLLPERRCPHFQTAYSPAQTY